MLLPITQYGSAVLRKPASRVPAVTPELRRLAVDMLETMYAAKGEHHRRSAAMQAL